MRYHITMPLVKGNEPCLTHVRIYCSDYRRLRKLCFKSGLSGAEVMQILLKDFYENLSRGNNSNQLGNRSRPPDGA